MHTHTHAYTFMRVCMARVDVGFIADYRIVRGWQQHADINMTILSFVSKRVGTHQSGACIGEMKLLLQQLASDFIALELQRTTATEAIQRQINDWRDEQRDHLRHQQATDNGDPQRLSQLSTGTQAEGNR